MAQGMGGKNRLIYLPQRSMFLFLLWHGPEWSLFGSDDPTTYLLDERGCACKRLVGRLDCNYIRVWMPRDFLVGMMERKCVHVFGSGLHIKWKEKKNNTCIWYPTSRPRSCGYPLHACLLCSMPLATGHLLEFLDLHVATASTRQDPFRDEQSPTQTSLRYTLLQLPEETIHHHRLWSLFVHST